MLTQIKALSNGRGSQMQRSLTKLDKEADTLADNNERITADNPQLKETLSEYQKLFEQTQGLILANDDAVQNGGKKIAIVAVSALVFRGVANEIKSPIADSTIKIYASAAKKAGIIWNVPDALDFARDYVNSPAWIKRMEKWGVGYANLLRDTVLAGIEKGWSPKYTAAQIRHFAQNMPYSAAENITRTLQLVSYRNASAEMEKLNGQYIEGKIRIATIDDRTCLACLALHGTPLKAGEEVRDHFRGRCDVFYRVKGGAQFPDMMQADSTPGNRQFTEFQTGEDWFNSLSPNRQAAQASFKRSPAKLRAFRNGVPISNFVGKYDDAVFGEMVIEKSLLSALGGDALQYYEANNR